MSSWNQNLPANTSKISASAAYIRNNNAATQLGLTTSTITGGYPFVPTDGATGMYFYTSSVPSGWTLLAPVADCLLGIQGGSSQYSGTAGTIAGTWTGPSYALQTGDVISGGIGLGNYISSFAGFVSTSTPPSAHHHDWTSTRPMAAVGLMCTKTA